MSHEGKMQRGKEYTDHPDRVQGNESRLADIAYFEENSKDSKKGKK